ncbi:hypothetical protein [Halorubrum lipolyticum]|uniref:Uncharacterized protein n=1 Tax=Halorubrum lipolyticum DSM 21995 TaxID=1227482 RepID=M0NKR8_9EURY|nr:hypothetical protein [Halorubrum lipolyticum]EMA58416.1 hypothetical protein C469_13275 [Halorubrum lipolyticum DSM 21995]
MTTLTLGRWLLVAFAIVGLALAVPMVSAHGNATADDAPIADDVPPSDATADDWAVWMEAQMTEHMGPDGVEWMESHAGATVDEMARDMADDGNSGMYGHGGTHERGGTYGHDGTYERGGTYGHDGTYGHGGAYGQGHC